MVVLPAINAASGGTTPIKQWYRLISEWQAVVLPSNGGGTDSTPENQDETLFGSNFEVIGAYKYPTLFYMKEHESVNIILNS